MTDVPTITPHKLIREIDVKLKSMPHTAIYSHSSVAPLLPEPAAYVLILGAGFSYGIVPLVNELMQQTIGDYYYYDQDQSSMRRPKSVLLKHSANFWAEFNEAAAEAKVPSVELDAKGLPKDAGAAYQNLFTCEGAEALFALSKPKRKSFLEQLREQREHSLLPKEKRETKANIGERFVRGFLRYVLDPGGESGHGSTGRSELNGAHIYLAALLEAQQLGRAWPTCAFCRTIFTTNFDTLLQNSLQMVNLLYRLTDRPEKGLDSSDFNVEEAPIHLVYVHGSILRHNPASTIGELGSLESRNSDLLRDYLENRDVIAIGYSGWNDGLMAALCSCASNKHKVYWCDIECKPRIASFIAERPDGAVYVQLGEGGANNLMRSLYETFFTEKLRDPMQRYRDWFRLCRS